jgi:hypothetical protein
MPLRVVRVARVARVERVERVVRVARVQENRRILYVTVDVFHPIVRFTSSELQDTNPAKIPIVILFAITIVYILFISTCRKVFCQVE